MRYSEIKKHVMHVSFIFTIFLFLQIAFRPEVLLNGRLLAEEGSIWWAHSLTSNPLEILFFVAPMTGYFLLNTNLLMVATTLIPVSFLALTTTWVSLLIQTQVAFVFLALTKGREWKYRILGFSIILFSPIFTDPETFANSINSQTYLALIPIVYLTLWVDPESRAVKFYIFTFTSLAFFSGWYSAILFPLFLIRYLTGERTGYHKKIVFTSFLAFLVQIFVYSYQKINDLVWPEKGTQEIDIHEVFLDLVSIVKFFSTGEQGLAKLGIIQIFAVLVLTFLCINRFRIGTLKLANFSFKKSKGIWLLLAFIFEYTLIFLGDASPGSGLVGRYLLVPSGIAILLIALVVGENLAKRGNLLFLIVFFSVQLSLSVAQYSQTRNSYLLSCGNPCFTWQENVDEVAIGSRSTYYFWPFNNGNPDWAISSVAPSIRLAPFQGKVMGINTIVLPPLR